LTGPLNLVAPNPVTNTQFTRLLGTVLRRPTTFPVPRALVKLVFGEMAEQTILASQRMRPRVLMDAGFDFALPTLEGALRAELLSS
jgi:NAD dependent epimerase/dehydratase family enzyme